MSECFYVHIIQLINDGGKITVKTLILKLLVVSQITYVLTAIPIPHNVGCKNMR